MDRIFITMPNTPVFSYVFKKRERVVCFLFFFLIFNIVCASNENITTKTLDEMRSEFQENPDRKDILNKVSVYISNLGKWIDEDSIYSKKKLNLIDSLEKQLLKTNDTREQYDYCYRLFLEYGDLSFDKMCAYALECNDLAEELGDKHLITSSKLSEAQTYIKGGFFREADACLATIDTTGCELSTRLRYLMTCLNLEFEDGFFFPLTILREKTFSHKMEKIYDEMAHLVPSDSQILYEARAKIAFHMSKYDEGIRYSYLLLSKLPADSHEYAYAMGNLGYNYMGKGDYVEAAKYMTESAIQEIKRGSKEYPAMRKIAELMYILGDIDNAYKFINVYTRNSFDYNSKYRLFELTKSYPQIEKILYQSIQKQQRQKSIFITLLLIIALLLVVAILFVFKQKRKLAFQNTVIEKQNQVLTDKTKCIEDTNQALLEAHHIKDIVLGQLIAGNANSIIYAEKIRKDICRKLKIKDYEGIKAAFEKPVDADRAFFSNIDNVILSIFPNFIDGFNSLLKEECRIVLKSKDSLVPEVRIFALIRLGISKNDDIAKCLNYSVSTVKCYKSKIMNASSLTNDEFYARLMQITFNEVS
jgi:cell division protein FtsL